MLLVTGFHLLLLQYLTVLVNNFVLLIEGDPNNYLTYYKRGTVYLALGKAKNALSDLDRVLELNPDFTPARITRGNVHLKLGNYDLAQLDFYNVVSRCFLCVLLR